MKPPVQIKCLRLAFPINQSSTDRSGIIHTVHTKSVARSHSQADRRYFKRQLRLDDL
jgi:hypothetical protein